MALKREEWLAQAKALPIGQRRRVRHLRERRMNMVVGNESGRWLAYCQACKDGGIVDKEHVVLTDKAPPESESLVLPHDLVPVAQAENAVQNGVAGFLAHKNMDLLYLPPVHFSASRKRILIDTGQGWFGRDTTDTSMQKWLSYNKGAFVGQHARSEKYLAIVVEDLFSMYKVRAALGSKPDVAVFCSLGTAVHDALCVELLPYDRVRFMYDGDAAGRKGAAVEARRFEAFGCDAEECCAPMGLDPKDMELKHIREHVLLTL